MSAPTVLNLIRVENGWIVCLDTDLEYRSGVQGKRFVFNTARALAEGVESLVETGKLPPPLDLEAINAQFGQPRPGDSADELDGMGRTD